MRMSSIRVLIVAKCIVNSKIENLTQSQKEVLIVAKCIVNFNNLTTSVKLSISINSSKVYCKLL